jgi:hypothetical protein
MAAQELLRVLTIGGGSACPGDGGGGRQRSQISLPSCLKCTKTAPNLWFPAHIDLKIAKKRYFLLKKIYSQDVMYTPSRPD